MELIGSISKLGNWNIETGKPLIPQNNNGKAYVDFIALNCNYRGFPSKFTCGSTNFDFDSGLMNDAPTLSDGPTPAKVLPRMCAGIAKKGYRRSDAADNKRLLSAADASPAL